MRDYLLLAAVAAILPISLFRPYIGVLAWVCFALLNPHRSTWGIAQTIPLSVIIGAVTLVGAVREMLSRRLPFSRELLLLVLLFIMFFVSTVCADDSNLAWVKFDRIWKTFLMVIVTVWLVNTRKRLLGLLYVIAFSVGIYGVVGGLFSLATGGRYRVYGPEMSFIADNNAIALALNMTLPFLVYLAADTESKWLKRCLYFSFALSIIAIVFTYSRGGLLGLIAVLSLIILKQKGRIRIAALLLVLIATPLALLVMPEQWKGRMETIETYESDESSMARIYAWRLAWRISLDHPFLGAGFQAMENKSLYDIYYPESPTRGDVHSVYFELLAETGFITFALFISLMVSSYLSARKIRKLSRGNDSLRWAHNYSNIVEVALIAFLISGAFQELATFDFIYYVMGLVMIIKALFMEELDTNKMQPLTPPASFVGNADPDYASPTGVI